MYDPYYLRIDRIQDILKDLIIEIEIDNPKDRRLANLIKAQEELKKAKMKDSCFRR